MGDLGDGGHSIPDARSRLVKEPIMAGFHRYQGLRVLVTGHTGFKGSWLCAWLNHLGAHVAGLSVDIPTRPSHFEILGLAERIRHIEGDVRDRGRLQEIISDFNPDVIFHLAAQPLVRRSYLEPAETFETNVFGTMNLLEGVRSVDSIQAVVLITSDKCYRNVEWPWGYRETDALGGKDPYSASKGCAELVIYSYHHSFFQDGPAIASTRAGNVIGGGDWAEDRIVPDTARAWSKKKSVTIRSPHATRPWQHVLEPLSGYLWLGQCLIDGQNEVAGEAFNFGPDASVTASVEALLKEMAEYWPESGHGIQIQSDESEKESTLLKLSCDKALNSLSWKPVLTFSETVKMTTKWYREYYEHGKEAAAKMTLRQIQHYEELAVERGLQWAR